MENMRLYCGGSIFKIIN